MNAANASIQASSLESERRAHEPSMEEILASIRKIIADDDALPLTRPGEGRAPFITPRPFETAPLAAVQEESAAAFDLGRDAPEASVPSPSAVEPSEHFVSAEPVAHVDDVDADLQSFAEIASNLSVRDLRPAIAVEPAGHAERADAVVAMQPEVEAAPVAVATIEQHEGHEEGADEQGILSPETDASVSSAFRALSASVQLTNAETIDRHVREMLRPMLKQWLDDNLPVMVERLVRAEIERVARGGR
ncbi:MAG: DUF2497 domain-containing protein [Hyphomicrobiales bacterium]|nr:DUF2497 domain-containing protein [Hyphomicrobiales bacterium]